MRRVEAGWELGRKGVSGGAEGSRTPDLLRAKQALSQLSYSPTGRRDRLPWSAAGTGKQKGHCWPSDACTLTSG